MRRTIIFLGLLLISVAGASAQPPAKRPDLPTNLAKYIDESPGDLMNVPAVKSRLRTLLGKRYTTFEESISVQAPIKMAGDFLFASGCMAHACTIMEAAFAIDVKNKRIHAVLFEKNNPPVYFNEDKTPTPQVLVDHVAELIAGATTTLKYGELSEYVNDWDSRADGEQIIVTGVPIPTEISYEKSYQMDLFKPKEDADVGNSFYTSSSLTKMFRPNLRSAAASLRVTCTLIRFTGESDVFRSPFATKVEGLDKTGAVLWTAAGPPPVKLKFRQ